MPVIGVTLLIQLACILHIIRTGRNTIWVMVVLFLPLVGAAAYFLMEVLPGMQGNRHVRTFHAQAISKLDPEREVRASRDALDLADTIANRVRLADALVAVGRPAEAIPLYRDGIARSPAQDAKIEVKLAQALYEDGASDEALTLLDGLPSILAGAEQDRRSLLRARIYEAVGRKDEALALYEDIVTRIPGEEARCRYAALLLDQGWTRKAQTVLEDVEARMRRLDRQQRAAEADMYRWAMDTLKGLRAAR